MSFILHDDQGYVCDLSSAYGCGRVRDWMISAGPSEIAKAFWRNGLTDNPHRLATELTELLRIHPPCDTDVADLAKALARGLRHAHGEAILTQ